MEIDGHDNVNNNNNYASIHIIPDEILVQILNYFDSSEYSDKERYLLFLVCKRFE
jgi:hypothetical protein